MESHVVDFVVDALFRLTLDISFRSRGETIVDITTKLVRIILDGREEIVKFLRKVRVTSLVAIPGNLIMCHSFVGS